MPVQKAAVTVRKRGSYREKWIRLGEANGLRLAGVVLGRTHTLKNGKLERLPKGREHRHAE